MLIIAIHPYFIKIADLVTLINEIGLKIGEYYFDFILHFP